MFARFFIARPVFATVISIVIVILGGVALWELPIAQYPEVAPPTIQVTAIYPGANAQVVAETVAATIEQEVNGVEGMLYMTSKCSNDGVMNLDITFNLGVDLDTAQVLVQNRVAIAEPRLPEEVRRQGVVTKKRSPSILLVVNIISPDNSRDQLFLSNYATLQIKDRLARLPGVGDVTLFGARDYSMRVWLDPELLAARSLQPGDVVRALREQNVQVAAGRIGQPPAPTLPDFQLPISTLGRLADPEQFGAVVVKTGDNGQVTYLRDVARIELGARNYDSSSFLDSQPSTGVVIFQRPGSNALATARDVRRVMEELKNGLPFPPGVDYRIVYDTTVFVEESVAGVYHTLVEAFVLVFVVVLLFLQDWKATILPMIDVPVSLIGTFAVMALFGFTLNNLTLFGLVLAIGIVVDDAIVVVENVERWIAQGLEPAKATAKAMDEVTGPVIAITLVLSSVFIPSAFLAGISGQFYRQFALTIAASTIISAVNAMTMTPSRAAQLFKQVQPGEHHHRDALPIWGVAGVAGFLAVFFLSGLLGHFTGIEIGEHRHHGVPLVAALPWLTPAFALQTSLFLVAACIGWFAAKPVNWLLGRCFQAFNGGFDRVTTLYAGLVRAAISAAPLMLAAYVGLMGLTWLGFQAVPTGFIPEQDKGYLVVFAQLPDGANLSRTEEVLRRVETLAHQHPAVAHTISVPGFSFLSGSNQSNTGTMFLPLKPFAERMGKPELAAPAVLKQLSSQFFAIEDALILVFNAPAVDGIGNTGGFKLQIQDRADAGAESLQAAAENLIHAGSQQPGLIGLFSSYRAAQPQLFLEVDRTKAKAAEVALADVFDTLQAYLGSTYVNDLTLFDRNWQVVVQADARFRNTPNAIGTLQVRSATGKMVPLASLITIRDITGPSLVTRYNMFPAADVTGGLLPGTSSGTAIRLMEQVARTELPPGMSYEWTELSLQEKLTGNTAVFVFLLGTVFIYLILAAQYENWTMPTAIILIVPMCLSAAMVGVWMGRKDNNIFTQIGLVVLVALASKNAILIVEFARQLQNSGKSRMEAAVEACKLRLRPIVMTSLAFILGVVPLVRAQGAGYEMRQALGVAVFSGMLGVTVFGLFFTPVFYVVIDWLGSRMGGKPASSSSSESTSAPLSE